MVVVLSVTRAPARMEHAQMTAAHVCLMTARLHVHSLRRLADRSVSTPLATRTTATSVAPSALPASAILTPA